MQAKPDSVLCMISLFADHSSNLKTCALAHFPLFPLVGGGVSFQPYGH